MNANIHIDEKDHLIGGKEVGEYGDVLTFDLGARSGGVTGEKWDEVTLFVPRERLVEVAELLEETARKLRAQVKAE